MTPTGTLEGGSGRCSHVGLMLAGPVWLVTRAIEATECPFDTGSIALGTCVSACVRASCREDRLSYWSWGGVCGLRSKKFC